MRQTPIRYTIQNNEMYSHCDSFPVDLAGVAIGASAIAGIARQETLPQAKAQADVGPVSRFSTLRQRMQRSTTIASETQ